MAIISRVSIGGRTIMLQILLPGTKPKVGGGGRPGRCDDTLQTSATTPVFVNTLENPSLPIVSE